MRHSIEWLLQRVEPIPIAGCWLWMGKVTTAGYGRVVVDGRATVAHRLSYRLHRGAIPDGLFVCHHCDVRLCVNPEHLFLGDAAANLGDMVRKGRSNRGERHGHSKLTPDAVLAIRSSLLTGKALAEQYGVARSCISRVRNRRAWSHL